MPSVLVVDDERLVRQTLKMLLEVKGYEVVLAEDGDSGIAAARARAFDVAIIDLFMPGKDGLTVIEAIRKSRPNIPMIAASGFMFGDNECPAMPNFESMAAEAGATAALYKPFRPDVLYRTLAQAMAASAA